MSWLNPIALWGLTALAVPVLIHLWSKNKTKEIAFGSIRFLRESSTLRSKKIQLSEIPLLLIRLLVLIFLVFLMAKWINNQEVEKKNAILLGEGITVPQAYEEEETFIYRTSEFGDLCNHWHLLTSFSQQYPEIDSLIYINEFKNTDFIGAIPKLNFHLELVPTNLPQTSKSNMSLDTLFIHYDELPEAMEEKFYKVLRANHLYTNDKVNFQSATMEGADLIFTNSTRKLEINQIVLSDSLSSDYTVYKSHSHSVLYLNQNWVDHPLHEDQFVSIVTEFVAQIVEPVYRYSSFEALYPRKLYDEEKVLQAKTYDEELFGLILLLILLERYVSYRKKHA